MTPPDRLKAALKAVCWSQRELSRAVSYDERTVRRWASGEHAVPPDVLEWIEELAALHLTHAYRKPGEA